MLPKGFKHSAETIQKMREWNLNRPAASEETRRKQSESARRKKPITDETRQRMSEAHLRRLALSRAKKFSDQTGIPVETYQAQIEAGNGWCAKCKSFKPASYFSHKKSTCLDCLYAKHDAWYRRNRDVVRERMRQRYAENINGARDRNKQWSLRRYGASLEWYAAKLEEQGGGCAICGTQKFEGDHKHFAVDHNHNCCSGKKGACDKCRRGLLCPRCNLSLERIESIPGWLESAVAYLRKYGALDDPASSNLLSASDVPLWPESLRRKHL